MQNYGMNRIILRILKKSPNPTLAQLETMLWLGLAKSSLNSKLESHESLWYFARIHFNINMLLVKPLIYPALLIVYRTIVSSSRSR